MTMQPTPGDVHVNAPLTNISIAFLQNANDFIASKVFPNIPVSKQSDRYYVYNRGDFNRDEMQERAPATESAGSGYSLDNTPTYYAPRYSIHKDIPDEVRSNADAVLNPDREATAFVTHKALIKREKLFVGRYFSAGNWGTDMSGVASSPTGSQVLQWSDANSDPIANIRSAKRAIREQTGYEPNKLVLGRPVFDALIDHVDIVDRIKYGQTVGAPAMANVQTLAALLAIDEILVMNAVENTAKEGQTASHSFIGGKKALLCHSATAPGLMTPSAGYTFSWTGLLGAGAEGNRIRQFRMENIGADRVEIDMCFDTKLVASELGYFFDTIVA
ncbi:Major capsid protein GpE [uncultured Caudovirales phage]|uniref:Major capsid protein GpE n=1 Tax=uncultured Caudovirales phage TaxID=2100421 RepID=A0A6J5KKT0_9CAUD|nr:Major capsid protein GpE [uncultured Caudovirales phage]CAB4123826.1 Major capsid protein GpE [uncultured Caudovirales phage]